jgi:hypothetical protein
VAIAWPAWTPPAPAATDRRLAALVVITIVVLGAAGLAYSHASATPTSTPGSSARSYAQVSTVVPSPTGPPTYQIGETVPVVRDGWGLKITISDVTTAKSYKGSYLTEVPEVAGDVFIAAKVTYEATTDGADYSSADWDAYCAGVAVDGQSFVAFGPKPDLASGSLISGRKAVGYVVYEVPATGEVRMSYKAVIFDDTPTFEVIIRAA